LEENKISPLISIHYEYIKQRKREEEKRSAARRGALTVVVFVFEENARENRERREREILCVWSRNIKRKDCKSSERYEENARALKHALY
jgi:inner membrane protein involved in colicin E2 resistance